MIASLSKNRDKPQKHSAIPQARHSKFFWRSFCICNFLKCLEQLTANDSHELILGLVIRCDIVIHVIVYIAYLSLYLKQLLGKVYNSLLKSYHLVKV